MSAFPRPSRPSDDVAVWVKEASMDWNAAIENNREALKRVLAMLVAMAGLDHRPATLPRHLHRAVLCLLRPAEAAVRRLIIAAARGIVIALPPEYQRKPQPARSILRNGIGTGIVMPRGLRPKAGTRPARFCLPLTDRLPRWGAPPRSPACGFPRISIPGLTRPSPVPRAPAPDDPVDAARLTLRLAALGRALDDLPREARRFARWRARGVASKPDAAGVQNGRDAAGAQNRKPPATAGEQDTPRAVRRFRRVWPLRPGRPPGGLRRPRHEVHEILSVVHGLAFWALQPDTS
ncbi:hypothetical protein [Mesorhizobium sp. KR9-304]|uniref:hypothetical protein n=1 Tax=Mesorhizobium sp. KR9-304 TaxID=3156614 RepID=UPI0032B479FC